MNTEERQVLSGFLDQLKSIEGIQKDPEADTLIAAAVHAQPDAAYLLVQKSLLQDQALSAAQRQIQQLREELGRAKSLAPTDGGFLAHNPWAQGSARPTSSPAASPLPPATAAPVAGSGGIGSFLGSAAATAAGVAGGAFLFQGLGSLFGHHGGYGFDPTGFDGTHPAAENITVNEYYGTQPGTSADVAYDSDLAGGDGLTEADYEGFDPGDDSLDL